MLLLLPERGLCKLILLKLYLEFIVPTQRNKKLFIFTKISYFSNWSQRNPFHKCLLTSKRSKCDRWLLFRDDKTPKVPVDWYVTHKQIQTRTVGCFLLKSHTNKILLKCMSYSLALPVNHLRFWVPQNKAFLVLIIKMFLKLFPFFRKLSSIAHDGTAYHFEFQMMLSRIQICLQ